MPWSRRWAVSRPDGTHLMSSRQLDVERLPAGTYLNTGSAATKGLRFNRFCYELRRKENRDAFLADPDACMLACGLADEQRALVHARDWIGLVRQGANVFVLLRLANLCGHNLTETGAQMRGETLEQYLASR
jgi:protocatechuate 4,5-dioxygenase alpha subunit